MNWDDAGMMQKIARRLDIELQNFDALIKSRIAWLGRNGVGVIGLLRKDLFQNHLGTAGFPLAGGQP